MAWFDTDWGFRKKITIDNTKVGGTVTDFPVLISLTTDTELAASAQNDGDDILFTQTDEVTKIPHEIEVFDGGDGELVAWVKVPSVSGSTDTDIYMYYGNATVGNQEDITAVWDSNYLGVWHLHDDFLDSTSNNLDGTNNSTVDIIGKIADGQDFIHDTNTQNVDLGNPSILNFGTGNWTIQCWWLKTSGEDSTQEEAMLIGKGGGGSGGIRYVLQNQTNPGGGPSLIVDDNSVKYLIQEGSTLADGAWHMSHGVRDGTTLRFYRDKVEKGTRTIPSGYDLSGVSQKNAYIGRLTSQSSGNPIKGWPGDIDEVRISNTVRSANWITTEYNNHNSPSTFFTLSSEESGSQDFIRLLQDPVGITDTLILVGIYVRSTTESVGITDVTTTAIGFVKVLTDTIGITDVIT